MSAQLYHVVPHVTFSCDDIFDPQNVFTVYADKTEIVQCNSIVAAVTSCFVAYWLFDIQYPKLFKNTLTFFDTYVLRKNSVRATQRVSTFINKLQLFITADSFLVLLYSALEQFGVLCLLRVTALSLCVFCVCFSLHCVYYCNMVGWVW